MSVHAAGLEERPGTYICTDLSVESLEEAVHPDFRRMGRAFREYAIAGTLHLDHIADMAGADSRLEVRRHAVLTSAALGLSAAEAEARLASMLERHAAEWSSFLNDMGARSFVKNWTRKGQ